MCVCVCMLGCVWSLDSGIYACMSGGVYAYMPAKVHLGVYTFACVVCLPRGRASRHLIIHQQRPYMSIPEPLSPQILIHYWEALPEENRPGRKLDTPTSWAAPLINSSSTIFLAASLSMTAVHHQGVTVPFWIHKQILIKLKVTYEKHAATNFILKKKAYFGYRWTAKKRINAEMSWQDSTFL